MANSVNGAGRIAGKRVLVIGVGPIGLACALWSRRFGAKTVLLAERIWQEYRSLMILTFFPVLMQIMMRQISSLELPKAVPKFSLSASVLRESCKNVLNVPPRGGLSLVWVHLTNPIALNL